MKTMTIGDEEMTAPLLEVVGNSVRCGNGKQGTKNRQIHTSTNDEFMRAHCYSVRGFSPVGRISDETAQLSGF